MSTLLCMPFACYKWWNIYNQLYKLCLKFTIWQDEKFERLFKRYADKVKLGIESLVFMFDGDKINLTATPDSLGMDDEDIIEVLAKKSWLTCPLMKFWYVIVSYQYFCLG